MLGARVIRRSAAVLAMVALALTVPLSATTHAAARQQAKSHTALVWATYYGWYDNTPPGCGTAYSGCAGGSGTYADPITFASYKGEFPVGTIIYYPTLKKYFKMGDECQECGLDWTGHGPDGGPHMYHLDLWVGGKGGDAFDVINCEDALTLQTASGAPVLSKFILKPSPDLAVSSTPIFNVKTERCWHNAQAPSTVGNYRNTRTGECLTEPGTGHSTPATVTACNSSAGERITFNGAFMFDRHLCLKIMGSGSRRPMGWAACDGDPNEEWELNNNKTITWMQYTRCLEAVDGRVYMAACTGAKDQDWAWKT
jgi:hypothetical protein